MSDAPWKRTERRLAALFGMRRNPLSGSRSGHLTSADAIPDDDIEPLFPPGRVYLEFKHSKRSAICSLFHDTALKAKKEKKVPIIVHHWHGHRLDVASVDLSLLLKLLIVSRNAGFLDEIVEDK